MNFTRYFLDGLKGTLRFNNGKNLSYKGPWVQVLPETKIDEFYVGDFMSAEYTICVDGGNTKKEVLKCLVVAGPESASITVFGRTNLGADMISLSASVDASRVTLTASPVESGVVKMIFSANYYYTVNDLIETPLAPEETTPPPEEETPPPEEETTPPPEEETPPPEEETPPPEEETTPPPEEETPPPEEETPPPEEETPPPTEPIPDPTSTYSVTPTVLSVNEGGSVTFNVATTNVVDGTLLYWTTQQISGNINTDDFTSSTVFGSFTINNNSGSIVRSISEDNLTEGSESFRIQIRTASINGTVVASSSTVTINDTSTTPPPEEETPPPEEETPPPEEETPPPEEETPPPEEETPPPPTYSINPSTTSVNEGGSVTFNVATTNVANGTLLYWTTQQISGTINSNDFTDGVIFGSFTINNNSGSIVRSISEDNLTEGSESFRIQIRTASINGTVVASSSTVTINDTSTTPPPEPSAETFTVTNSGASAYIINSASNPTLTLTRGSTYTFNITASGHPFWIKTQPVTGTGSAYSTGVTNNGVANGTLTFAVPQNAPNTLYYICQFHGSMVGTINVVNAV